ncbi:MAG: hypothetical protein GY913_08540 [Proteobacteria bacterium]|nr:hypothetical protein [Pseudomonadota bacterium]MCP4916958.1 hypothetical protein [Pseudomonadota bacterium]
MTKLLTGFRPEHAELWGRHPVCIEHGLADTGLFSDDALAALLEDYPRENYDLLHMAEQGTGNLAHWTEGDLGRVRGREALDAITSGRLWINLRRVHEASPAHLELLEAVFAELAERVPGFHPYKLNLGILISSPGAQVYYHSDVPGQSLWHLRGAKRVFVYPNRAPFLPEEQIEKVVLSLTEAEIDYEPWFDDYATVFDLQPGQMLHWPLNAPHRVENGDCINVSVTTEHFTTSIQNSYAVRYANGLIRRGLRGPPPLPNTRGGSFWARAALTVAVKKSGLLKARKLEKTVEWELDPAADTRMRAVTPLV